ncbi:Lysophospholipase L1 [Pseudoxanthomonas wuyuanensis]|uniref:Lysophospholipase L1 n=2 Tax=Pseudoxanthomonas wuyuanensis TaxID=1073196 RepID=A0A286D7T4_9GAMM|nr:Lysophospholipase L1 [Pseudoxanthomonas wuyuanensis]
MMPMFHALPRLALLLLLTACAAAAESLPTATPQVPEQVSDAGWEQDMQRFAAEDATSPPPAGAVLFIGSSSIRLWDTLAADFPGVTVINRGFGGSEIRDSTWYADRIVVPYRPRLIVLYAGDNDLNSGRSPRQLLQDFRDFVLRVRRDLPDVRIAYIASKPSPSRAALLDTQRQANALIQAEAARQPHLDFIDVFTPMLDASGQPREELFIADRLHMNRTGYALWQRLIAPYLPPR